MVNVPRWFDTRRELWLKRGQKKRRKKETANLYNIPKSEDNCNENELINDIHKTRSSSISGVVFTCSTCTFLRRTSNAKKRFVWVVCDDPMFLWSRNRASCVMAPVAAKTRDTHTNKTAQKKCEKLRARARTRKEKNPKAPQPPSAHFRRIKFPHHLFHRVSKPCQKFGETDRLNQATRPRNCIRDQHDRRLRYFDNQEVLDPQTAKWYVIDVLVKMMLSSIAFLLTCSVFVGNVGDQAQSANPPQP